MRGKSGKTGTTGTTGTGTTGKTRRLAFGTVLLAWGAAVAAVSATHLPNSPSFDALAAPLTARTDASAASTTPPTLALSAPGAPTHALRSTAPPRTTIIDEFCLDCHDKGTHTAGLVLETFDPEHPELSPEIAEKVIKKLRAGLMPPPGNPRPDAAAVSAFVTGLETTIDQYAALHPNPGARPFQRLNRAEYARSIHDLLGLDVDVDAYLPPDTISHDFDNVADVQGFSPAMMEGYLRAASAISRLAVGDAHATPATTSYKVPRTESQVNHVEGTPYGTRGGLVVTHNFPADGTYVFRITLHASPTGQLFGLTAHGEQLEVAVNSARVALLDINPRMSESDPNGMNLTTDPIPVKAGPQRISASFIKRFDGPVDDLIEPIEHTLADTQIGTAQGITTLPHVREFGVTGPFTVTGVSDTPSRERIFTCHPAGSATGGPIAGDEKTCAPTILGALAREAYRRPVTAADVQGLMTFFDAGRKTGSFDDGIRTALQAILASPGFVFRVERVPATAKPGQAYRISDIELASRLSYFLWASVPDAELVSVAGEGHLKNPDVLDREVRRMLADPRAEALSTRFAAQWLHLQDLAQMQPDALLYPHYDETLTDAMTTETELFFDSIVKEDHNVLDLLTADYTFVNERLAAHYGIPDVSGPNFRRVTLKDDARRGLLGEGSILVLTSVADRTSPVQRGKWVMEVLLGTPPTPPPPNVPPFDNTKATAGGRTLSVRERMEEHRKNPVCNSCHRMMDPIGLALENFDPTGAWRIKDNGVPVDPRGTMYDGSPIDGPASLRKALLGHSDIVLRNFTQVLMTYALGRRVEYYDMPTVRAIVNDAAQHGNRFSSFVMGVVKSPAFQMSTGEEAVDTAGKGQ